MARVSRRRSASGVYHVVLRGINKQTIFFDDTDRKVFLNRLKLTRKKKTFNLFAYCLMSNHIHLLIEEDPQQFGSISEVISNTLTSYVFWYNQKYERSGNLFQDRFRSEPVERDSHLLCAVRYIHQNPVKAAMVESPDEFKWSSYHDYLSGEGDLISRELVLEMLQGRENYIDFMQKDEVGEFIDNESKTMMTDEALAEKIASIMSNRNIYDLQKLERGARDELITIIKALTKASIRQISRVTGISISQVRYADQSNK